MIVFDPMPERGWIEHDRRCPSCGSDRSFDEIEYGEPYDADRPRCPECHKLMVRFNKAEPPNDWGEWHCEPCGEVIGDDQTDADRPRIEANAQQASDRYEYGPMG